MYASHDYSLYVNEIYIGSPLCCVLLYIVWRSAPRLGRAGALVGGHATFSSIPNQLCYPTEILKCDWSGLEELQVFYCPTTQEDFYLFSNITNLASAMVQLSNICDS